MADTTIPASADDAWLSPWLNWLESVESLSGRREFTAAGYETLHERWKAGDEPAAGAEVARGLPGAT